MRPMAASGIGPTSAWIIWLAVGMAGMRRPSTSTSVAAMAFGSRNEKVERDGGRPRRRLGTDW